MSTFLKKENKKPLIIGLTGGIGSGKSTVSKVFQSLGVPVFNSDIEAKNIVNNNAETIEKIINEFGNVYQKGQLDRVKMAEVVFNDKKALDQLNKIVHPKVREYFEKWLMERNNVPILIKEAAILIESGAYKQVDKIILITAPKDIRVQRVIYRDNVSEQKVKDRINAQLSDEEKLTYSDFVITNDDKELVIPQVLEVYNKLID
ncbi:dephospho-CoA kinase [Vicingaceae bacterium]|nr:dephospho-CoA kinase [Vicingaceae bacterium]